MTAHKTAFSIELRVLACAKCGAPVEGEATGGAIVCGYCNATNQITARRDEAVRTASTQSEAVRIERLREQDGRRLKAPPGLEALLEDGIVPDRWMDQAKEQWLKERQSLQLAGNVATAERFYFLTNTRLEFLARTRQDRAVRCTIETALEHLTDERYQQVLHAELAAMAARAGDRDASAKWLALCTPRSDDLHMDSAFREAQACLSTMEGDWRKVLQVLGMQAIDVPIADERDDQCALLRANALERSGMGAQAVSELLPLALADRLTPLLQRNSGLQVCPESASAALAQARAQLEDAVDVRARDDMVGMMVAYALGALALIVGATAVVVWVAELDSEVIGAVASIGSVALIVGGGFWNYAIFRAGLDRSIEEGRARVLSVERVGPNILAVRLLVHVADSPSFVANLKTGAGEKARAQLRVGYTLPVDVPHDPRFLFVRWNESRN